MSELSSLQLLSRLIGFATVSRDSNLEMIAFVGDYLEELGVQSELFYDPARGYSCGRLRDRKHGSRPQDRRVRYE